MLHLGRQLFFFLNVFFALVNNVIHKENVFPRAWLQLNNVIKTKRN